MGLSGISTATFQAMVKHLAQLDEEKDLILNQYYPEVSSNRDDFQELIQSYVEHIELYLKNVSSGEKETEANACPFVLINSEVEVEDINEKEVFRLRIVSPFQEEKRMEVECASYLSPIGKALLLRKVNDEVQVKTPMQTLQYKIKRIELDKIG